MPAGANSPSSSPSSRSLANSFSGPRSHASMGISKPCFGRSNSPSGR